jgi:hypothetical protein
MMPITGVMPLPPASSSRSSSSETGVKAPAGGASSRMAPARTSSQIQFEARPSRTRLTVIFRSGSVCGELESE